jgi:hypothetical protein
VTFSASLLKGLLYAGIATIFIGVTVLGFFWVRDLRRKSLW